MQITPPSRLGAVEPLSPGIDAMQAEIEIWWLNATTYRTEIRSAAFRQTRIVNGSAVEEENIGGFYPRWIQNFVDALLEPIPHADQLSREPGSVPVSDDSHACISRSGLSRDDAAATEICFQGKEPLLASGITFNRYVAFDNFTAFGHQLIPRTLINDLPANTLLRGEILTLDPVSSLDYPLLKVVHPTPLSQQIRTQLLSRADAESMLLSLPTTAYDASDPSRIGLKRLASYAMESANTARTADTEDGPVTVYVRTDITGRVREAYTDRGDIYNRHQGAVARAMQLRFRPLLVNGALLQIEAPVQIDTPAEAR